MNNKKNSLNRLLENMHELGIYVLIDKTRFEDPVYTKKLAEVIDDGVMNDEELEALCVRFRNSLRLI